MEGLTLARTHAALIEDGSDLCIGVMIEQPVDFVDHCGAVHPLLPGVQRKGQFQSLGGSAFEANLESDFLATA
jgi:hypothetical protein